MSMRNAGTALAFVVALAGCTKVETPKEKTVPSSHETIADGQRETQKNIGKVSPFLVDSEPSLEPVAEKKGEVPSVEPPIETSPPIEQPPSPALSVSDLPEEMPEIKPPERDEAVAEKVKSLTAKILAHAFEESMKERGKPRLGRPLFGDDFNDAEVMKFLHEGRLQSMLPVQREMQELQDIPLFPTYAADVASVYQEFFTEKEGERNPRADELKKTASTLFLEDGKFFDVLQFVFLPGTDGKTVMLELTLKPRYEPQEGTKRRRVHFTQSGITSIEQPSSDSENESAYWYGASSSHREGERRLELELGVYSSAERHQRSFYEY